MKGKPVIWKIIQRRSCAVLITNVRSGMRDMILKFAYCIKKEKPVYLKREKIALYDCTNNDFIY